MGSPAIALFKSNDFIVLCVFQFKSNVILENNKHELKKFVRDCFSLANDNNTIGYIYLCNPKIIFMFRTTKVGDVNSFLSAFG